MQYQFYTLDVFSDHLFGGNQLAVFPEASGLTPEQMQQIAAEFNLSETSFVFAPTHPQACHRVRIFTPKAELPFAGHPTLGTAYLLGAIGAIPLEEAETSIYLEEAVGLIEVKISSQAGKPVYTELSLSQPPEFRADVPPLSDLARLISLPIEALQVPNYAPQAVSSGLPFLIIPVANVESLSQAQLNQQVWENLLAQSWANCVYLFAPSTPEDWRVRMFAPSLGIQEDPATGAAAAAFGAYLGHYSPLADGNLTWTLAQGKEIARPSILRVTTVKSQTQIAQIRVGGASVLVSQGVFYCG